MNPAKIAYIVLKKGANRPDVKGDILKMIIIGVERGNKISTMHEKCSEDAAKIIKELKKEYGLVDKPGKSLNALTLSRVALAFPHLACEYSSMAISRTVPVSSLPEGFPLHMTHSAFANLIPVGNQDIMTDLVQILLYYQVKFSYVVDKNAKKGTYEEAKEKAIKYTQWAKMVILPKFAKVRQYFSTESPERGFYCLFW